MTPTSTATAAGSTDLQRAADLGVGARITLSVMADDFRAVILRALREVDADGLVTSTDEVSTFVRGSEQRIAEYVVALIAAAARSGRHVSATVLFSRGCPGEVCRAVPALPTTAAPVLTNSGIHAVGQWTLYPLADGAGADHMRDITAVIDDARRAGVFLRSDHFVTTLAGDIADVVGTVVRGWVTTGRSVQHVTTHVTISVNSPTAAVGAS